MLTTLISLSMLPFSLIVLFIPTFFFLFFALVFSNAKIVLIKTYEAGIENSIMPENLLIHGASEVS